MPDAAALVDAAMGILWIALAVAVVVFVVAGLSRVFGPLVAWAEPRISPWMARRSRARYGLPPDAPRWACGTCRSVNEATATSCYRCGASAADAAEALPASDELYEAPLIPVGHFDPSLYRGPGAPTRHESPGAPAGHASAGSMAGADPEGGSAVGGGGAAGPGAEGNPALDQGGAAGPETAGGASQPSAPKPRARRSRRAPTGTGDP